MQERFKNIISNRVVLVVLLVVFVVVIALLAGNRQRVNPQAEGELVNKNTPGFFEYNKKPYLPSNNSFINQQLGEDIAYYARSFMNPYKTKESEPVLFSLSKEKYTDGEYNVLKGSLTKNKDQLEFRYRELKNSRVSVIIKNLKSKKEESNSLPSNSKRNKYISSLPINTDIYSIDYLVQSDTFTILISSLDDSVAGTAINDFQSKLGIKDLKEEKVNIKYEGTPGGGVPY